MRVRETALEGVLVIEPDVYADDRGHFLETHREENYPFAGKFVQDNLSFSRRGVLRGLHLQWPRAQGKLIYVPHGEVFDVVVDVRRGSPTYGRWIGHTLSAENNLQAWIPAGFAHGFAVTSESAQFLYKCTEIYEPSSEVAVRWNDPALGIEWPFADPELSPKDAEAPLLEDIDPERLPNY